jgi:hypothetical protein
VRYVASTAEDMGRIELLAGSAPSIAAWQSATRGIATGT